MFQEAVNVYKRAHNVANQIRINGWSLYLCLGPHNAENTFDLRFYFESSHLTKEDAIHASKTTKVSPIIDPIWFVVEEIISASGERYELDGRLIRIYKQGEVEYTYRLEEGVFNSFLFPDEWIPYYRAGGGLRGILHFLFKQGLPDNWDEKEATDSGIEWSFL